MPGDWNKHLVWLDFKKSAAGRVHFYYMVNWKQKHLGVIIEASLVFLEIAVKKQRKERTFKKISRFHAFNLSKMSTFWLAVMPFQVKLASPLKSRLTKQLQSFCSTWKCFFSPLSLERYNWWHILVYSKLVIATFSHHCWFKDFLLAFQGLIKDQGWNTDQW